MQALFSQHSSTQTERIYYNVLLHFCLRLSPCAFGHAVVEISIGAIDSHQLEETVIAKQDRCCCKA
jgi:hypothetical protein